MHKIANFFWPIQCETSSVMSGSMMIGLSQILSRGDETALEDMLGKEAVHLLRVLRSDSLRTSNLRQSLLRVRTPQALLVSKNSRQVILDLMTDEEIQCLSTTIGLTGLSPRARLSRINLQLGTRRYADFMSFFGVDHTDNVLRRAAQEDCVVVTPVYSLFEHQREAVSSVRSHYGAGRTRVLLHMPTGSGKTRTAMSVVCDVLRQGRGLVVWLASTEELCEQASAEFETAWGSLGDRPVSVFRMWGTCSPDLRRAKDGLLVAGLAKLYSRAVTSIPEIAELGDRLSLLVFDEAHQAIAETYKLLVDALMARNSHARLLGLSATPGRSYSDIDLDHRLAEFFMRTKVTLTVGGYDNPIDYLVESGFLAKPLFDSLHAVWGLSLSREDVLEISRNLDFPRHLLERISGNEVRNALIVGKIQQLAKDHRRILYFGPSVKNAELIAVVLQSLGLPCRAVSSNTSADERASVLDWYTDDGDGCRVIANYGVLTTGFDAPLTSCVVIARPTKSLVLYSQMVGRALRGERVGGHRQAQIVTVIDDGLPEFYDVRMAFLNWEDVWQ